MKYFAAVLVLAACAYAQEKEGSAPADERPTRAIPYAAPAAYPATYVAGAPVAYAHGQPAYASPLAYAAHPQPAAAVYKPTAYVAAPHTAYVAAAPHAAYVPGAHPYATPVAYAAQPAYVGAYKTYHV